MHSTVATKTELATGCHNLTIGPLAPVRAPGHAPAPIRVPWPRRTAPALVGVLLLACSPKTDPDPAANGEADS